MCVYPVGANSSILEYNVTFPVILNNYFAVKKSYKGVINKE